MSRAPRILIDGYNLLFQSQLVGRGRGPKWLERARQRLLNLLQTNTPENELAYITIVFDANSDSITQETLPPPASSSGGLAVLYAWEHPEADDLLEEIIRFHPHPKTLTVVSSDHRIQRSAKARRAKAIDSEQFLEQLEKRVSPSPERSLPEKPLDLDESDIEFWLREFEDK